MGRFLFGTHFAFLILPRCWGYDKERKMPIKKTVSTEKEKNNAAPKASEYDCLVVTNVRVFPFKDGANMGHVKALAKVVLNDQMQLTGLRVMDGENGLFVSYPFDPFYKGEEYRSIFFPITRECRQHIENCVLEKYQEMIAA